MSRPKSRPRRAPADAGRNAPRFHVTMLPSELAELDALAARTARPGYRPNRSEAIRLCVGAVLNAEADGLLAVHPAFLRWKAQP
jgi:hypothetical protein